MTFLDGRIEPGRASAPISHLLPGDHACWFFRSPEAHREGVTAFIREGLEAGSKVVYLADAITVDTVAGYLRLAGLDPDGLVAGGRLVLRSFSDDHARGEVFDSARQLDLYGELLEQVRADGDRGLWLTAEGTWGIGGDIPAAERHLEYEQLVERLLAASDDAVFLCQFDSSAVNGPSGEALRSVHNLELDETGLRPLGRNLPQLQVVPTEGGMALSGTVDMSTWATLWNALARLTANADGGEILLDVGGLWFIDGHGMTLISKAARQMNHSSRLVLRGASPMLVRVAGILGLDREPGLVIRGRGENGER